MTYMVLYFPSACIYMFVCVQICIYISRLCDLHACSWHREYPKPREIDQTSPLQLVLTCPFQCVNSLAYALIWLIAAVFFVMLLFVLLFAVDQSLLVAGDWRPVSCACSCDSEGSHIDIKLLTNMYIYIYVCVCVYIISSYAFQWP